MTTTINMTKACFDQVPENMIQMSLMANMFIQLKISNKNVQNVLLVVNIQ